MKIHLPTPKLSKCYLSFREGKLLVCPPLLKQHAWGWGWYSEIPWSCLRKENLTGFHHPFILRWISIAQNQTVKHSNHELDMTYFNRQNRTLEIWHGIHLSNPYPKNYLWDLRIHYVQSTPTKHQVMLNQKMMFDITTFDSYSGNLEVLFEQ